MATQQAPEKIVLASGNKKKLVELTALFQALPVGVVSQAEFNVPEVPEDGLSFIENALIKARAAAEHTGLPAIADDSGIEVDFLDGAPGIYSARYAGTGSDEDNNNKLLQALEAVPLAQRTARFQCVIVYMRHAADPTPIVCQGSWEGEILQQARGENGFGYDPLFWLPEFGCSSAELPPEVKNTISHRAKASAKLLEAMQGLYSASCD